ncbi:MAG: hypothetical protein ACOY0T_22505 [Myxococcota bacterium]
MNASLAEPKYRTLADEHTDFPFAVAVESPALVAIVVVGLASGIALVYLMRRRR